MIDTREKLIVTSLHVVKNAGMVGILFPLNDGSDGQRTLQQLEAVSPYITAQVVATSPGLDLALLRAASLPRGTAMLRLAESTPLPGSSVYAVSHAARNPTLFHFDRGTVEFAGFAAVTVPEARLRAEVFCYQAKRIDKGSSGCALVNSNGEVVGFNTMCSGLIDSSKVNNVAVSVRELQRVIKKQNPSASTHSLIGRWVGRFTHSDKEMGVEFTSDGKVSFIIPGGGKLSATYELKGMILQLKVNGKVETVEFVWLADHAFRLKTPQFEAACQRHDGVW
ncbi:MAG TPA: serine protease [Gemmatales bacterium]|nr:serine protease [Gemmatales bacterium]